MARRCVTHHHACDCREEKFKKMEAENAKLREAIETHRADFDDEHFTTEEDRQLWQVLAQQEDES